MIFLSPASLDCCPFPAACCQHSHTPRGTGLQRPAWDGGCQGGRGTMRAPHAGHPCRDTTVAVGPTGPLSPWGAHHSPLLRYVPHLPHSPGQFPSLSFKRAQTQSKSLLNSPGWGCREPAVLSTLGFLSKQQQRGDQRDGGAGVESFAPPQSQSLPPLSRLARFLHYLPKL